MKKLIALILVLSMSISVMLSASAASKVFSFYLFGRTWSFSVPYREKTTKQTTTKQTTAKQNTTQKQTTTKQSTTQKQTTTAQNTGTYTLNAYEKEVIRLINEIRVKYGLNTLSTNTKLSQVARLKSQDMHLKLWMLI